MAIAKEKELARYATTMQPSYMHVGARLSDVYIQASRATSRNLSLQEQIKECAKDMIEEPSLNIQFTLKSFLLDYMQSMTGEDKSVCLGLRQSELKTHGVDLEAFKGLTVDAEMLGTIIATVHQLQGHF